MLARSGSGDSYRQRRNRAAVRIWVFSCQRNGSQTKLPSTWTVPRQWNSFFLSIQHHMILRYKSCTGYTRPIFWMDVPPLTLNLHRPPMSSLLSKQTGSKPSSTQILIQARPELPPPITATRRTMTDHLPQWGQRQSGILKCVSETGKGESWLGFKGSALVAMWLQSWSRASSLLLAGGDYQYTERKPSQLSGEMCSNQIFITLYFVGGYEANAFKLWASHNPNRTMGVWCLKQSAGEVEGQSTTTIII